MQLGDPHPQGIILSGPREVQHDVVPSEGIGVVMAITAHHLLHHQVHADQVVRGSLETHQIPLPTHPALITLLACELEGAHVNSRKSACVQVEVKNQKHLLHVLVSHQGVVIDNA